MKHLAPREICRRASLAVERAAASSDLSVRQECKRIGISNKTVSAWRYEAAAPDAWSLSKLHNAGYDVLWILTGEATP